MTIGDRLREVRTSLGDDQKTMSKRFGLGDTTWQRLELEDRAPKGEVLAQLLDMGFDINWLLSGTGHMRRDVLAESQPIPAIQPMQDGEEETRRRFHVWKTIAIDLFAYLRQRHWIGVVKPEEFKELIEGLYEAETADGVPGTDYVFNIEKYKRLIR